MLVDYPCRCYVDYLYVLVTLANTNSKICRYCSYMFYVQCKWYATEIRGVQIV